VFESADCTCSIVREGTNKARSPANGSAHQSRAVVEMLRDANHYGEDRRTDSDNDLATRRS
jgi:hypothetical protein